MSWRHYCLLMRIDAESAHSFYEIEAVQGAWSVRELERQIGSMLYERLAITILVNNVNEPEIAAISSDRRPRFAPIPPW